MLLVLDTDILFSFVCILFILFLKLFLLLLVLLFILLLKEEKYVVLILLDEVTPTSLVISDFSLTFFLKFEFKTFFNLILFSDLFCIICTLL